MVCAIMLFATKVFGVESVRHCRPEWDLPLSATSEISGDADKVVVIARGRSSVARCAPLAGRTSVVLATARLSELLGWFGNCNSWE